MSGGGAEYGTTTIKAMVGSDRSVYTRDKSGASSRGGGGGDGGGVIRGRGIVRVGQVKMEGGRLKRLGELETI